jgi:nucleoid-associated protein YejK
MTTMSAAARTRLKNALERNPRATKGKVPGTVAAFLAVLTSKVTQYDKAQSARESKRGTPNIYRLGLLLQGVDRVRDDVSGILSDDSPQALEKFRKAVLRHMFADFPPAKSTLKQVDQYLATGQAPSLTRR